MADFLTNLWESVFISGPTPTLVVATNAAFAALQVVLLLLLVATHSIHCFILSFLCGGLWFAINWFVRELRTSEQMEMKTKIRREKEGSGDESGTETEEVKPMIRPSKLESTGTSTSTSSSKVNEVMKRRSLGEISGTDSEWDKVEVESEGT